MINVNELLMLKDDTAKRPRTVFRTEPPQPCRVPTRTARLLTRPALSSAPGQGVVVTDVSHKSGQGKTPLCPFPQVCEEFSHIILLGKQSHTNKTYLMCQNIDIMPNVFWGDAVISVLLVVVTFEALVIRVLHHIHL